MTRLLVALVSLNPLSEVSLQPVVSFCFSISLISSAEMDSNSDSEDLRISEHSCHAVASKGSIS